MPPKNMAPGRFTQMSAETGLMDLAFDSRAGRSSWTARRDAEGALVPFGYDVTLMGVDQSGAEMELRLTVSASRPPVPVGASTYNGRFCCLAQPETFSHFQTGMHMHGSPAVGRRDRGGIGIGRTHRPAVVPCYPPVAAAEPMATPAVSYERRTIHLDNGADVVAWRQFDRRHRNAQRGFTGATVAYADGREPVCVEDIEVDTPNYVRWPRRYANSSNPGRRALPAGPASSGRNPGPRTSPARHYARAGARAAGGAWRAVPLRRHHARTTGSGFQHLREILCAVPGLGLIDVLSTMLEDRGADHEAGWWRPRARSWTTAATDEALTYLAGTVRPVVGALGDTDLFQIVDDLTVSLSAGG